MATRSLRWRGFVVEVTVPQRLAARFQRRGAAQGDAAGEPGGVAFLDPPPVPHVRQRDPSRGLDFRSIAETRDGQQARQSGIVPDGDLAERVLSTTWYHTIELPGGIATPGQFDHRRLLPRYGIPEDLAGKRALDVATFNGFWAFELERRGAEVTAIDLDDPREWDYPTQVRPLAENMPVTSEINAGFRIAHAALGSSVKRVACSVYDLTPEKVGTFDFVHCGDVLVHLREPLKALERIRSVTTGQLLLSDGIDVDAPRGRWGPTTQYLGGWDDVVWWVPSLDALAQMVIDAGFRDLKVNCVYQLAKTYETSGFWRASVIATV